MASAVEIKIEPMDDEYPVIKQEELIIKTEIEDPTYSTYNQVQEHEFETLIPKEEPIEEDEHLSPENIPEPCGTYILENRKLYAYKCISCKEEFTNDELLLEHRCSQCSLTNPIKKCDKCGETISVETDSNGHTCNNIQCKACDRIFSSETDLKDHLRFRCRSPMNCPECNQVFRTKLILIEHMRTHLNKKKRPHRKQKPLILYCHYCNTNFADAKLLQTHYFLHGFICGHKCIHCGQFFKYNHGLRKHIDTKVCSMEYSEDVTNNSGSDENDIQVKDEDVDIGDDNLPLQTVVESNGGNGSTHVDSNVCSMVFLEDVTKNSGIDENLIQIKEEEVDHTTQTPIAANKPIVPPRYRAFQYQNHYQHDPLIMKPDSVSILQHITPHFTTTDKKPSHATIPRIVPIANHQSNPNIVRQNLNNIICKLTVGKHDVVTDRQGNAFILQKNLPTAPHIGIPKIIRNPKGGNLIIMNTKRTVTLPQQQFVVLPKPMTIVKVEPEEPAPSDSMDLLLEELFDRKAQSKRKAAGILENKQPFAVDPTVLRTVETTNFEEVEPKPNDAQLSEKYQPIVVKPNRKETTDFDEMIVSSHLIVKNDIEEIHVKTETEAITSPPAECIDTKQDLDKGPEDFEEMILSNMLPKTQMNDEVIKDLTEEYLKAKKKKKTDGNDEVITDDSSQHSVMTSSDPSAPQSIYLPLKGSKHAYSTKLADKRYRYYWVCSFCPRRYLQRYSFRKHLETHSAGIADDDTKLYELRPERYNNEASATDTYCHLCRVELADIQSLIKHQQELHGQQENVTKAHYQCVKCGKFCSSRSTLMDHMNADCGTKPQYGCETCGKKFYTNSTLNLHRTMHTGVLPHECGFCKKRFRTRGQLTVHTRTHTGERPFPCKVCDRRFTHRETLISHLSRHIDMKRYKCTGCEMLFSSISGMKNHRMTRMDTCGKFKFSARPVGPRVRVIKGNVIFEPQPKINPYFREDEPDDNSKDNGSLKENENENDQEMIDIVKMEPMDSS